MRVIDVSIEEDRSAARLLRTIRLRPRGLVLPVDSFWYEFQGPLLPPPVDRADAAVIATIFLAMRLGAAIHVQGKVCRGLLANLDEFQDVWACWKPEAYRKIALSADEEIDSIKSAGDDAVLVFSGGVDSSFTLVRHVSGRAGRNTKRILAALLIHGFDIPASDPDAFARATDSARAALGVVNVPLVTVRTNWRPAMCRNWEMEFCAGLAGCLHHFEQASIGLVGSDEDYAHLALPWGSNPISNPLLSSATFRIVTDGSAWTRTEKIRALGGYPALLGSLRVCWEGEVGGVNCGACEKCIRTQLNLLACGLTSGPKFVAPLSFGRIALLRARNRIQRQYLLEILTAAKQARISSSWVVALRIAIARSALCETLEFCWRPIPVFLRRLRSRT